jgi:3',5'-nucleoside bisphosphate phosphatase
MSSLVIPPTFTLGANDAVDLHMHTTYSDGHWSPSALFDHLAERKFRLVAVTDHDEATHIAEMQNLGLERGIAVLSGVEMTASWQGHMAHVLCYGFDPARGSLSQLGRRTVEAQLANTQQVYDTLLQQGYSFPRRSEILANNQGRLNRPIDNAILLRDHGYAQDTKAGTQIITEAGFVSVAAPLADVVDAAHADGGVALIAHPGRVETGFTLYTTDLLDEIRTMGPPLDGIEVVYPLHSEEQIAAYQGYAVRYGWLAGAGSDSHGPRQRLPIEFPAVLAAVLLAQCGVSISA